MVSLGYLGPIAEWLLSESPSRKLPLSTSQRYNEIGNFLGPEQLIYQRLMHPLIRVGES